MAQRHFAAPAVGSLLWLALLLAGGCTAIASGSPPDERTPHRGMTFASWWAGEYASPEAGASLANLAATGADWVAIIVTGYQDTHTSTGPIRRKQPRTPADADLIHAIARAHELGLRVLLKPHVDLDDDPGHWRGRIGDGFTSEAEWQAWFSAYRGFIEHYARLAQDQGVALFSVGTELLGTSHREDDWREVVRGVRRLFDGPLTYAANHGGEEVGIAWWDAVDYIGVDAYYPLSDSPDPSLEELRAAWVDEGYVETLAGLARTFGRRVLLTELGYRSATGAAEEPWVYETARPADPDLQARAYQAALEVLWGRPWLAGIYWWYWDTDPTAGGPGDTGYTPFAKPAQQVLRSFWLEAEPRPPGSGLPAS
jgi:hypothetical protein